MTIESDRALAERRYDVAGLLLEQMLAAAPDDATGWFNLGYCRRMMLDPIGAVAAYDKALAAQIYEPEAVHLNKAVIFSDLLHDVAAARDSLQAALVINSAYLPAWLNLGQLEEDAGNAADARSAFQAVLALQPGHGRALAKLAAIDIFAGRPQDALDRLVAERDQAGSPTDVFEIEFAVAAARDALGDHDAAFDHASRANVLQRSVSGVYYDRAHQARQVDAVIALFPDQPAPAAAVSDLEPLFICGLFRSGSTLLETLINRRFGIAMGGELDFTPWFTMYRGAMLTQGAQDDFVAAYRQGYTDFCRTVLGDERRFTDKRMDNFLYIGLIKRAFPDARIIHTVRNPIDNFLSMFFLPFADTLTYANDFDDMLHLYRQYRRLMAHWQTCYGDDIITLNYDDLVASPDAVLANLGEALGLQDVPSQDNVRGQIIRTASAWQVREPVHQRSSGRWRRFGGNIEELAAALRREFPEFDR